MLAALSPILQTRGKRHSSIPMIMQNRESQNYRMLRGGRDLCGSSSPTPCSSRVTQSRLHRTASRWVLNFSREGDSTTSLGNLFQCSVTLRVKKFFLMFSWNFLCFSLCPLPLVLSLGTTEKKPTFSSCPWLPQAGWIDSWSNNMSYGTSSLKIRILCVMFFSHVVP